MEGEFEWSPETLREKLGEVGVPDDEARATADRVWDEWLARGGRPMSRGEDMASDLGLVLFLAIFVGGWLVGVGFLVWLVVTRVF